MILEKMMVLIRLRIQDLMQEFRLVNEKKSLLIQELRSQNSTMNANMFMLQKQLSETEEASENAKHAKELQMEN